MCTRHPERDIDVSFDEHKVIATGPEREAAGVKAVIILLQRRL